MGYKKVTDDLIDSLDRAFELGMFMATKSTGAIAHSICVHTKYFLKLVDETGIIPKVVNFGNDEFPYEGKLTYRNACFSALLTREEGDELIENNKSI